MLKNKNSHTLLLDFSKKGGLAKTKEEKKKYIFTVLNWTEWEQHPVTPLMTLLLLILAPPSQSF